MVPKREDVMELFDDRAMTLSLDEDEKGAMTLSVDEVVPEGAPDSESSG
jgi:hypothetical protein